MSHVIRFSDALERATNEHVQLALEIWHDAEPDPQVPIYVTAGNYAGYGAYAARCHSSSVIEIPLGNRNSVLRLDGNEITFNGDERYYLGVLLHEVGHHIVNTARSHPWSSISYKGSSTHLCQEWLWICQTGWSYFHEDVPTVAQIRNALHARSSMRTTIVESLRSFSPYRSPPSLKPLACDYCGGALESKRARAKYCSDSCRVMASRMRKRLSMQG